MRLDRALSVSIARPILRVSGGHRRQGIPILMYHSISEQTDMAVHPYYRTVCRPETFEGHMKALGDGGFQSLALTEAVQVLSRMRACDTIPPHGAVSPASPKGSGSSGRPIVITFDDGLGDFYTAAFPILERFGFTATVFLATGYIGRSFVTGRECLRAGQVKELAQKGIEFGSHTVSHPHLVGLPSGDIMRELSDSKSTVEQLIGRQVASFSYPYRFPEEDVAFTQELRMMLIEAGYKAGVTTAIGVSRAQNDPLFLSRLPINDADDPRLFRAKLQGAYDWMRVGQLLRKKLRRSAARLSRRRDE